MHPVGWLNIFAEACFPDPVAFDKGFGERALDNSEGRAVS